MQMWPLVHASPLAGPSAQGWHRAASLLCWAFLDLAEPHGNWAQLGSLLCAPLCNPRPFHKSPSCCWQGGGKSVPHWSRCFCQCQKPVVTHRPVSAWLAGTWSAGSLWRWAPRLIPARPLHFSHLMPSPSWGLSCLVYLVSTHAFFLMSGCLLPPLMQGVQGTPSFLLPRHSTHFCHFDMTPVPWLSPLGWTCPSA